MKVRYVFAVLFAGVATLLAAQDAKAVLAGGAKAMGIQDLSAVGSYTYSGSGVSYKFGEATNPKSGWPQSAVTKYTRTVDFDNEASLEEISRAGENTESHRMLFTESYGRVGKQYDIWMTPLGFLKRANTQDATARLVTISGRQFTAVSFVSDKKYTITAYFGDKQLLNRIATVVDHPVLGDMPVELLYSDYKDFGHGLIFPAKIVKKEGGGTVLDLTIDAAIRNPVRFIGERQYYQFNKGAPVYRGPLLGAPPPIFVDQLLYGDGVYYFGFKDPDGEFLHSVVVEFNDYLAVVEAPLDSEHSSAVIAEIHRLYAHKPIRYVINTRAHFIPMGGLRAYAAEGATIITQEINRPYLEKVLGLPHTIAPDKLSQTRKRITIETVADKRTLTDGNRSLEIFRIPNGRANGLLAAYLPKEKLVIEGGLYSPKNTKVDIDSDGHADPAVDPPETRYGPDLTASLDALRIEYKILLCLERRAATRDEFLEDIKKEVRP